jgi:hypothetical protein
MSLFSQKLKESQYGIAEDSVNYIPIERIHKNMSHKVGLKDSISEVQYYESRYEYPSEDLIERKFEKEDERGYFKFDSQYLNSV